MKEEPAREAPVCKNECGCCRAGSVPTGSLAVDFKAHQAGKVPPSLLRSGPAAHGAPAAQCPGQSFGRHAAAKPIG